LAAVVVLGGMVGPVLLLLALRLASAGSVSLLLNLEMVATAVLGALLFHERLRRSAWLGVGGIVAACLLLSGEAGTSGALAAVLVSAACICWAIDNHCSALIDGMTPARSTLWKGLIAGVSNLALGLALAPAEFTARSVAAALAVGAASYGASVALHTAAAQRIGAVRAQGVFASAPFIGAGLSWLLLGEPATAAQLLTAALFLISVVALVGRRHDHLHGHAAVRHIHAHVHDDGHHLHEHAETTTAEHTHWHEHDAVTHAHRHWPDLHHRHRHEGH